MYAETREVDSGRSRSLIRSVKDGFPMDWISISCAETSASLRHPNVVILPHTLRASCGVIESSAFNTAQSTCSTKAPFSLATPSSEPSNSKWLWPMFVMTPTVGLTIRDSRSISPGAVRSNFQHRQLIAVVQFKQSRWNANLVVVIFLGLKYGESLG